MSRNQLSGWELMMGPIARCIILCPSTVIDTEESSRCVCAAFTRYVRRFFNILPDEVHDHRRRSHDNGNTPHHR